MNSQFKDINYRGILSFRIPATWMDEYEEAGGGIFYLDEPDSATFRVNILTFETPGIPEKLSAENFFKTRIKDINTKLMLINNGNTLISYWKNSSEENIELATKYWEVANLVHPNHIRVAVFSYTMLKDQSDDRHYLDEMDLIEQEILSCKFSSAIGASKN